MKPNKASPYTTDTEIKFIDGLGVRDDLHNISRHELLKRYKTACKKRVQWDQINRRVVMQLLNKLTVGQPGI